MDQSHYESILNKARAVNELAERGIEGEAEAAKAKLILLMAKYGLTLEEIGGETTQDYEFICATEEECDLLRQVIYTVCQTRSLKLGSYLRPGHKWSELTAYQYVEVSEMYAFYRTLFRKEIKKLKASLVNAFVNQHHIFPANHKNKEDGPSSSMEDIGKLMALMSLLDNEAKYHKA